ncbi:unnamed protein product [Phytophthora fragariaefolia]|uniref:Unnamed protein product n=1 Tax=Phytophthora fragariaefolia TaxID=1490495 RepID=A0A9W6WSW9_9STRA|nr:unnamed protein product [Phytophthora fragariaefolia]
MSLGEYKKKRGNTLFARDELKALFDVGSDANMEDGEEGEETSSSKRDDPSVESRPRYTEGWTTVQRHQGHSLAPARSGTDLNRRPSHRADYMLDQCLEAGESLSDVVDALAPGSRSPTPWKDEISELRDDVARLTASEASLRGEVDLRLKDERLCNQASHERNTAFENHRWLRLDHADAARQLVVTNIALEQSSQADAVLEQRCRRLDKSLADTHKVSRQDRECFKADIASYAAQIRQLREYLDRIDRQSSVSSGAGSLIFEWFTKRT